MKKNFIQITILLMALIFILSACGTKSNTETNTEEKKPVAVEIQEVKRSDIESKLILNGKITPAKEIVIIPKLAGKVAKVNFDIGQKVRKGNVLFVMDEKDVRLQVAQAEASLKVAQTNLDRAKGSSADQQLVQTKIAFDSAELNYNNAKEAYDEAKDLYIVGAIQKDALDRAEAQFNNAEQQYNSAKSNMELAQNKAIPESIAIAEAQYMQALASYNTAKAQLDNIQIISPIDGIVAVRNIDAGELASSASVAMSVVDISEVTVGINVTEGMINRIKVGDAVTVKIPSIEDMSFQGSIENISPNADTRLQTYPVKIKITNADGILKGGMFAEVEFVFEKAENSLVIPLSTIKSEEGKNSVYIIENDTAYKKEIITGIQNGEFIEVKEGLEENDKLVIKGQDFLQDGAKVVIK